MKYKPASVTSQPIGMSGIDTSVNFHSHLTYAQRFDNLEGFLFSAYSYLTDCISYNDELYEDECKEQLWEKEKFDIRGIETLDNRQIWAKYKIVNAVQFLRYIIFWRRRSSIKATT